MPHSKHWLIAMLTAFILPANAQHLKKDFVKPNEQSQARLNYAMARNRTFKNDAGRWILEAEDPSTIVKVNTNEIEIISPKGATLWLDRLMEGNTIIEYDARIISDPAFRDDKDNIRISDLNCFWMADRCGGFGGKFANNYALQLYYMGYGGNWNTTTRFRRYTGYPPSTDSTWLRPVILREYTDSAHLLKADHTYHIRLEAINGRVRYTIDGERLVDYVDPHPLTCGYFGFRTTLSHAVISNFRHTSTIPDAAGIPLRWIGTKRSGPVTFGVPFAQGEARDCSFVLTTDKGESLTFDDHQLARWQDGSSKWHAFTAIIPEGTDSCRLHIDGSKAKKKGKTRTSGKINTQKAANQTAPASILPPFSITLNNIPQPILHESIERQGKIETVRRFEGKNFILRAYTYHGSNVCKLVHTLLVDSALNATGLSELSLHFRLPLSGKPYERYVQFDNHRPMSVQPLVARRPIHLDKMDQVTCQMLDNIAKWDAFRLSQLSPGSYSIRKRTTSLSPWIGTIEGHRSEGQVCVGDSSQWTAIRLMDFWQSYPSTLLVEDARSDSATITVSLYSPEAESYSFAHYDTIAHTLEAAYEDVQPGLSTACGIARTSTIYITSGTSSMPRPSARQEMSHLLPTPDYLHRKRAFGLWSLPTVEDERDSIIEQTISDIMTFYETEIERNAWYGFFNYGDIMHAYDSSRDEWRYDVGGYAWDNTELGSPSMLWYQFLRTGSPSVWRMAEAMTRHCSEVDTYHTGDHAGLGSRHNVVHWGCGAKEARISEAWWNRFYYYLTADDRTGDILHEVKDADTLLYHLDPMRLAQPRDLYPCSAPARLRIGPDWMAYASNWYTEWERTGDVSYRNKLLAGIQSIIDLPHHFFQGPLALGYDPATGRISSDQPDIETTNHLMPIMGGFELMNELMLSEDNPRFFDIWRQYCEQYQDKALLLRHNKFRIPRLQGLAGWMGNKAAATKAWQSILDHRPLETPTSIWTNDCATWVMDAIFIKETCK